MGKSIEVCQDDYQKLLESEGPINAPREHRPTSSTMTYIHNPDYNGPGTIYES